MGAFHQQCLEYLGKAKTPKNDTQSPPDTLVLNYHPDLVFKAVVIFERTKRIPTVDEIRNIDVRWYNDIMSVLNYLEWIRADGSELPKVISING